MTESIRMIENNRCCRNCQFYEKSDYSDERGQCHRYPPQIWTDVQSETSSSSVVSFPDVTAGEWCGEFQEVTRYIVQEGFVKLDKPIKCEGVFYASSDN